MEQDEGHDGGDEDRLRQYFEEVALFPLLTKEDEARLAQAAQAGDDSARRRLIESNLRLVVAIARRYQGRGLRLADLIQEGNIWLARAVDEYDWQKGYGFSSYATWWIRRGITEALRRPGMP